MAAKGILETDRFVFFWGGWPSQWHPAKFTIDGVPYNCCEQYMMAEKARVFGDPAALEKILATPDPRKQKALGRKVKNFDATLWDEVCRGVVFSANLARFNQDPALRELLLATGDKVIVEASPTDRIWGIGLAKEDPRAAVPKQWNGTNWLGVALMQVRENVRPTVNALNVPDGMILEWQLERRWALARDARAKTGATP